MHFKPVFLPVLIVCCFLAEPTGYGQQFISSHRVSPYSPFLAAGTADFGSIYGVADFNGDGRPDFLTWTWSPSGSNLVLALMLQNSNGTFTKRAIPSVPLGATVVADVNGDGRADIVTALSGPADDHGVPLGPSSVIVSLGRGDGTFNVQPPVFLAGNSLAFDVLVRDLNGDKKPDIVAVTGDQYGDAILQTLLNNGAASFHAGPTYNQGLIGGKLLAAGDFNGDGFPDLVVLNNFQTQILLGKGDGAFAPGATYNVNAVVAGVGDLNRDHRQDLVLASAQDSKIMLGKGDGTFDLVGTLATAFGLGPNVNYGAGVRPTAICVCDLNHDGIPDVAVTSTSSTMEVAVYSGKGDGTFRYPKINSIAGSYGSNPGAATFADMNRDGRMDVVSFSYSAGITIAYGDVPGGFQAPLISQAPNSGSIAKGDFNGDGIDDIAVVDEPLCSTCGASVRVFRGSGKGYLLAPETYPIGVNEGAIAVGDVNGDGKLDIVVTRNAGLLTFGNILPASPATSGGTAAKGPGPAGSAASSTAPDVSVLIGRGDGTFEAAKSVNLLGAPAISTLSTSAYLIDVNHDGKLDLVGDWGTALGKGNGEFGMPIPLPSNIQGIVALAPGDFNGDGKVGLAIASDTYDSVFQSFSTPSYLYVLSGDGTGSFHITSKQSTGVLESLITADLNGDGLSDILYTASATKGTANYVSLGVNRSTGQGTFSTTSYLIPSPYVTTGIVTGDFNRDGKTDVAILGLFPNGGDVALLKGAGDGTLNKTPEFYQGSLGSAIVLDLNGDGAPDIAGTTTIGVARLLNTGHR